MSFIRQKRLKNKLKQLTIGLIAIYLMIGTALYFLQEKIIFRPTVLNQTHVFKFSHPFEELFLKADDNAIINAIHFKLENPKGVIIYFHGNAGDLSRWGKIAEYFVDRNYDLLIMDYRTYGKSTGVLSEHALYSDAQMCYDYLKDFYSEDEITVYGRSLGTGIATYIAANNKPKQLVLETPYYSLVDVAKRRFPFLTVQKLMHYRLPTNKFLNDVSCEISMIHGTNDYVISIESAKKLYQEATKNQTQFVEVKNGGHNDLVKFREFNEFINKVLP